MAGKWIQAIHLKKGALHSDLNIPPGKKISASILGQAAKRPGKTGQRARLALTFKSFRHK